jgi:hypothetical protein
MTAGQAKPAEELRMDHDEFDRIMGKALRVKPEVAKASDPSIKAKPSKTKRARK